MNDNHNTELIAGNRISFKPGFHAKEGSHLHARIDNEVNCSIPAESDDGKDNFNEDTTGEFEEEEEERTVVPMEILELEQLLSEQVSDFNVAQQDVSCLIFPNPNSGIFQVSLLGASISGAQVQVFNPVGVLVYEDQDIVDPDFTIDLSQEMKGVYILHLNLTGQRLVKKVVVE